MIDRLTTVNRRTMLSVAAGTAVISPGCSLLQAPPDDSGTASPVPERKSPQATPEQTAPVTRRLFRIFLHQTSPPDLAAIQEDSQSLSRQARLTGDLLKPWDSTVAETEFYLTGWLTPVCAAGFRKLKRVRKVEIHQSGAPVPSRMPPLRGQLTDAPPDGKRNLIVILGPNSWSGSTGLQGIQTAENIAEQWKNSVRNTASISVSAIRAAQWPQINQAGFHIGPIPGQIRITIDGKSVPTDVLKIILSHPQVERLQWDHAEVIYKCPPCGMG